MNCRVTREGRRLHRSLSYHRRSVSPPSAQKKRAADGPALKATNHNWRKDTRRYARARARSRAALMRLLLRDDGVLFESWHPLDQEAERIPLRWDGPHVAVRFHQGLKTLITL